MVRIQEVIRSLSEAYVEYVIVGGIAIRSHSSSYVTYDFDLCYLRSDENLKRIVEALAPHKPHLRDFPLELPFIFDQTTLRNGLNFTFSTEIGDIDLLGEVAGVGDFQAVLENSEVLLLYGFEVRVLTLDGLIKAKRAAGRPKDLLVLPELEALQEALNNDEE